MALQLIGLPTSVPAIPIELQNYTAKFISSQKNILNILKFVKEVIVWIKINDDYNTVHNCKNSHQNRRKLGKNIIQPFSNADRPVVRFRIMGHTWGRSTSVAHRPLLFILHRGSIVLHHWKSCLEHIISIYDRLPLYETHIGSSSPLSAPPRLHKNSHCPIVSSPQVLHVKSWS